MVNLNAWLEAPRAWTPVVAAADLAGSTPTRVEAAGCPILSVRRDGRISALVQKCSHAGSPLAEGELHGDTIVCLWHGSRFSLADGHVLNGPATFEQPCYTVREQDGIVEVRLADGMAD